MWKNKNVSLLPVVFGRLIGIMVLLAVSRWLLYIFNTNAFADLSFKELTRLFFIGFRFDVYPLIMFNLPFLVFYCAPIPFKYNKICKKIIDVIFVISNALAIALNLVDVIYFRYLDKRSTSEILDFFKMSDDNQGGLIWIFARDFWFMIAIFFVFLFLIILLTRKTRLKPKAIIYKAKWYVSNSLFFILMTGACIIGSRGGLQEKPFSLVTAGSYTLTKNVPLVINTPFAMIRNGSRGKLPQLSYFDDKVIDSLYNPLHYSLKSNRFIKKDATNYNLVILILESFGQEMISFYNEEREQSLTPFLDSLLTESLSFEGMANGRRSIEAIPSIFSGVPSLMTIDFPTSKYAANTIIGLGTILKRHGYKTAYFHGGTNGTMNFDSSAKANGFDDYYGRSEYRNDDDFNGSWGIHDGPFLQYTAKMLNRYKRPFAAGIFTLSSHHPYTFPDDYVVRNATATQFEKTVEYADDALKNFFNTVSQYEWFDSTLFVIVADHVNPDHTFNDYTNARGKYRIPIAFYAPNLIQKQKSAEMVQQVDIAISTLSALNIDEPVFSFGRNIFDSTQRSYSINNLNNIFLYSDGEKFIETDGEKINAAYVLENDPFLQNDIYLGNESQFDTIFNEFKARKQQYNNRMIHNKLYIK